MEAGKIKFFINDKGYGFVVAEDGAEYFCHICSFKDIEPGTYPEKGQKVLFDTEPTKKGPQAINLQLL